MMKVKDIIKEIELLAPKHLAAEWDNVGLMVGSNEATVNGVYVCLDVTSKNVEEAINAGCNLIVAHHPLIFNPIKSVTAEDTLGSIIHALLENNVSVYSAHTNFDICEGGLNDILADKIGVRNIRRFTEDELKAEDGKTLEPYGVVGKLDAPVRFEEFAEQVASALDAPCLKYVGDLNETVSTVGMVCGGGGSHLYAAYRAGADVYVSSDFRHHEAQQAQEIGLNLIDAGHFETENLFCGFMQTFLGEKFEGLRVTLSTSKGYFDRI